MPDLNIRNVTKETMKLLKVGAAESGLTLRDYCLGKMGVAPIDGLTKRMPEAGTYSELERRPTKVIEAHVALVHPKHDSATCRVYKCGQCALSQSEKKK